ncbi:MAG TPA: Rieske 2Fe-2S domain-containing protein [Hyphomicrobiales bacterium]|nr:Rieske 2Fe-2S domain-containing protein [Hyphomicrobiales bacterium]
MSGEWHDLGPADEFKTHGVREVRVGRTRIAISWKDGEFGAISGVCNHVGGPLGGGWLDGDYVVCPWHYWKFHRLTGEGEPGFEEDKLPRHPVKEENGRLLVDAKPSSKRNKKPHAPHPLARREPRPEGPIRVAGISTTMMDPTHPRPSTSEALLETALDHAGSALAAETRLIRLSHLRFRACEGFYSKDVRACTWPCSITEMDDTDEMKEVYETLVHWADVVLVATPIRWGAASALYYKMAERLNCVQNQITIANRVLIRNKVAGFIVTGGQDNVQAVAGQLMTFFSEIGFQFPQFPFIGHSRGWSADDMEANVDQVLSSKALHDGARGLAARAVKLAGDLLEGADTAERMARGGRKGQRLDKAG